MQFLNTAPLWLIGFVLAAVMVTAEEIGFHCRMLTQRGGKEEKGEERVGNLVGAALALLGLLFAFTFAMAQDRYDQRRRLVMQEANAVSTSYLRYQAFEEPERSRLSRLMRDYAVLRSEAFDAQREREKLNTLVARTAAYQAQIWDAVLAALARQPALIEPVMESTNNMFEITAMRRAMVDARIPSSILVGLLAFAVLTAFFTGYGLELERRHRAPTAVLFLLFAFVFLLILDLDRSYSGPIRVSQASMVRAAETIAALEAAKLEAPSP
ncbi:hypothetical protein [Caulobacter sp. 17J80-11]|uniref:bestrophin-like domain n=1 Tax=Caulobacter sp. 17J80-11 TaxID=2763502 RepID=UPI0016535212|nr:hypothetical protein [Caulobacter sp. 17J80-11]MBC6983298.1 hypothetical protein [Caulobacter sp. 17J80-11]